LFSFDKRHFRRTDSDREWHFFWATVSTVRGIFHPDSGYRLADDQMINHFPNHFELTRKDLMVKNLKRYRKELEREGSGLTEKEMTVTTAGTAAVSTGAASYIHFDFFPLTYTLPSDYSVFLEEFKRSPSLVWILKPNGKSQGKGIYILHKLSQLKKWYASIKFQTLSARDSYVVSRYVDNPLLIGGKKFDLRLYCLVTKYRPLKAYQYNEGFARFCNVKYSSDVSDLDNQYIHLTNVAIQKNGEEYNEKHGNKWSVRNLRLYLEATRGYALTQKMFEGIQFIMIHALKSVKDVMNNDKHCFEVSRGQTKTQARAKGCERACTRDAAVQLHTSTGAGDADSLLHSALGSVACSRFCSRPVPH
jgi:tubulin polyglutamylase TTLL1